MNTLQLWPTLLECHHQLSVDSSASSDVRMPEAVLNLDELLHAFLHSFYLPHALSLIDFVHGQMTSSGMPPSCMRLVLLLARSFELMALRNNAPLTAVLLSHRGAHTLVGMYRSQLAAGTTQLGTALYFLLLALLTADNEPVQTELLIAAHLWSHLVSTLASSYSDHPKPRLPATQHLRLLALSLLLPAPAIRAHIAADSEWNRLYCYQAAMRPLLRDSLAQQDYTLQYTQVEPLQLLDDWHAAWNRQREAGLLSSKLFEQEQKRLVRDSSSPSAQVSPISPTIPARPVRSTTT